jgi:hypothetical protein
LQAAFAKLGAVVLLEVGLHDPRALYRWENNVRREGETP